MRRSQLTRPRTPLPAPPAQPSLDDALDQIRAATAANPMPLEDVLAVLAAAQRRNLAYLRKRQRWDSATAYLDALEQEVTATASALHYLGQYTAGLRGINP